jgi:cobalamin biosynthesis protein CobW
VILAETTRQIPILPMTDGIIDPRVILGLHAAAENDIAARPSHHDGDDDHEHDDFNSVVIDLPEITDPEALADAIRTLAREQHILRVKGYVAVTGKPMRLLVQAVGERVRHQFDRPWPGPRQSQLVVIAEHHRIDAAAIRAVLLAAVQPATIGA